MSSVRITPLSAPSAAPLSHLLELDDVRILINIGCDAHGHIPRLLRRTAPTVDLVLLSHPRIEYLGGLVAACSRMGLGEDVGVYGTLPVVSLGRMAVLDRVHALSQEELPPATLRGGVHEESATTAEAVAGNDTDARVSESEVTAVFDRVTMVKYSQPVALFGKCSGVVITAYPAGHSLGGTIWRIQKDGEVIVYAIGLNHKKERHLSGGVFLHSASAGSSLTSDPLVRASVLIFDARNAIQTQPPRKSRDIALLDSITATLSSASPGSILIPVDASARVLEIAYLLDQHWSFHNITTPIVLLSPVAASVMNLARGMLEWMGDAITAQFSATRTNPFEFKHVKVCESMEDLNAMVRDRSSGCVVLATQPSLESGFARQLFVDWAPDPNNTVIMVERCEADTLAGWLMEQFRHSAASSAGTSLDAEDATILPLTPLNIETDVVIRRCVPLKGQELEAFNAEKRAEIEHQRAQAAMISRGRDLMDAEDTDSEAEESDLGDDNGDDNTAAGGDTSGKMGSRRRSGALGDDSARLFSSEGGPSEVFTEDKFDVFVLAADDLGGGSGYFRHERASILFPVVDRRRRYDDYGEVTSLDHYTHDMDRAAADGAADRARNKSTADAAQARAAIAEEDKKKAAAALKHRPMKQLLETVRVHVRCRVQYIDLEGLSDGRSLRAILPQLAPRKLALLHGTDAELQHLAEHCRGLGDFTEDIQVPAEGESVSMSSAKNVYQINLTDALLSALSLDEAGEYELAYVSGRIRYGEEDATVPSLEPIPAEEVPVHEHSLVGNMRLPELRRAVEAQGMSAVFAGDGVLVCNESVALKKTAGVVRMEGRLGRDYFKVRKLLYASHAQV